MSKGGWLPGFAVVLILLFAVSVGLKIGYQDGYGDGGDNATAYQQSGAVSDGATTKSGITDDQAKRNEWRNEEDLNAQRNMAEWAAWMFAAAVGTLIVTGIGVLYIAKTLESTREAAKFAAETLSETTRLGNLQLREAKNATWAAEKSVKETRRLGEAQARAYLTVLGGQFEYTLANKTRLEVSINIHNSGNSPAKNATFAGRIIVEQNVDGFGLHVLDQPLNLLKLDEIGARETQKKRAILDSLPATAVSYLHGKTAEIGVIGTLSYLDVFETSWPREIALAGRVENIFPDKRGVIVNELDPCHPDRWKEG